MTGENAYSSQIYFDQVQRSLFRQNWVCAGFGHQVPNPGDIAPVTVTNPCSTEEWRRRGLS